MDAAALCGVSDAEFWNLTPAEFERRQWAHLKTEIARGKNAWDMALATGWWAAVLSKQKRIQSLHSMLNPARQAVGEERIERQAEFDELNARLEERMRRRRNG